MLDDIRIVIKDLTIGIDFEFFIDNGVNVLLSLVIYFITRILFKERWIFSYTQLLIAIFLPVVAYLITTIISSNIALSLGMIGALSIVRFRHPVKSPLELIMYFALITVGIATSVRTKWAIQLVIVTILIILLVKFFQVISKKYGKSFYNTSFNEGVSSNTLEIIAKNKIDLIEKNEFLISSFNDFHEKKIVYRLNFENKNDLQTFKESIEKTNQIEKINTIYN